MQAHYAPESKFSDDQLRQFYDLVTKAIYYPETHLLQVLSDERLEYLPSETYLIKQLIELLVNTKWVVKDLTRDDFKDLSKLKETLLLLLQDLIINEDLRINSLLQCLFPNTLLGKIFSLPSNSFKLFGSNLFTPPDIGNSETRLGAVAQRLALKDLNKITLYDSTIRAYTNLSPDVIEKLQLICGNVIRLFDSKNIFNNEPTPLETVLGKEALDPKLQTFFKKCEDLTDEKKELEFKIIECLNDQNFTRLHNNPALANKFFNRLVSTDWERSLINRGDFSNVALVKENLFRYINCELLDRELRLNVILQCLLPNTMLGTIFYFQKNTTKLFGIGPNLFSPPSVGDTSSRIGQLAISLKDWNNISTFKLYPTTIEAFKSIDSVLLGKICGICPNVRELLEANNIDVGSGPAEKGEMVLKVIYPPKT